MARGDLLKRLAWVAGLLAALSCQLAHAGTALIMQIDYQGDDGGPAPTAAQYRNPVVAGFHPDPSAVRVGDDFYLVNSSFGYFPGLPVFKSSDLVHWNQIGNAIDRPTQINYGNDELTRGLFAASISYHAGTFYIANTCFYCDGGNFLITATDPAGPWSDPIWLDAKGIDPSLFFDDDGSAWLVNNDVPAGKLRYDGHRAIWLQRLDLASMKLVGTRQVIVDSGFKPATNPEHIEGPHLFRRDGYYYLTAAEGGTGEQHAQMIYRSRQITGPYETWSGNPVLTQRDLDPLRNAPITSAGHAQFVELKDGTWWAVFLATRPYRGNHYNLGRETFLLPVQWRDGWPVVLPHGAAVPVVAARPPLPAGTQPLPTTGPMQWSERFGDARVPMQWMTIHPPIRPWYQPGAQGLRVTPANIALGDIGRGQPAYLGHRLQHHHATLVANVDGSALAPGEQAGLAIVAKESNFLAAMLVREDSGAAVVLYRRAGAQQPGTGTELARAPLPDATQPVKLRFALDAARVRVDYAVGQGQWQTLLEQGDASVLSTESAGGFLGATFGPYAYAR
ncbi:glycoside hydrolase family 43 protein [Xanthomonas axonopodis]|uniref:glycoside hydrolase family 43 protein n=1 Tax=Xanthomonas axonopodis TaxID=53413 RepID=UPI00355671DA